MDYVYNADMKIAIISDTHGLLRPEVLEIAETCDAVVHGGDIGKREILDRLAIGRPIYAVRGNNDGEWAKGIAPLQRFRLAGLEFVVVHDRKDVPWNLAGVDVVVFGHTHNYYEEIRDGRLWLNPGSCGIRRFYLDITMAVMTVEDGRYEVKRIVFETS